MILLIIYLLGLIPAFLAVMDIFRQKTIGFAAKLALATGVFLFSWVGYFAYWFVIRHFVANRGHLEAGN